MQRIQVGNGQYVSVLFIILKVIDIHGHRFEIFTLVPEIHEKADLVLGIKNIFELEGIINSQESCFSFQNRSVPFCPKEQIILKPKEQRFIKMEAPFIDEISGLAIVKMLDQKAQQAVMLKLKFVENLATLHVTNNSLETVIFDLKKMFGIFDLRSVGYYEIKQGILQKNLSKYYKFKLADILCEWLMNL